MITRLEVRQTLEMADVVLGLIAIAVGCLFCFRGYLTMRLVIPIWGAFVGFSVGVGVVAGVTGDRILSTAIGWLAGAVLALAFALFAYLYYEVSVMIAMAGIGFVLGSSAMVALNITWTWLIVLVGIVLAIALGVVAIIGELPMVILTLLTATSGSLAVVGGLMLLFGSMDTSDLDRASAVQQIEDRPGWWLLFVVLAIAGVIGQIRTLGSLEESLRRQWVADGGRQFINVDSSRS